MKKVSVTEVLSLVQDFSDVPAHILEKAADRGKAVHKFIELNLLPQNLDVWKVPDECIGYTKAWDQFFENLNEAFGKCELISEKECVSSALNLVGHPDLIVVPEQGESFVTDVVLMSITRQAAHELQVAAYWHLARCTFPSYAFSGDSDSGVLYLRKDGTYDFWRPWDEIDSRGIVNSLNEFITILKTYRLKEAINVRNKSRSS